MPPASKGKGKGRDVRQSRSRNTTPSSGLSSSSLGGGVAPTYLDNGMSQLLVPTTVQYSELLETVGGVGPIPDSKSLEILMEHLKTLSQLAETRGDACNAGMRELHQRLKNMADEDDFERDSGERLKVKHEMEDEETTSRAYKGGKLKKRKERGSIKEERPLTHGAHGVARQDGAETKIEGAASPVSKKSKKMASESASSLSPTSLGSPRQAGAAKDAEHVDADVAAATSPASDDSSESHQPEPAPSVPQIQVFGLNPLEFDDPTIYHIREVTPEMADEEKKEIYCVDRFPKSDLRHLMAGVPPDKDFSNAKPTNQVSANTFLAYIEPFVRPLMEEDIAFLKEKGDRTTPFVVPRRGKKHYTEIWAEEDEVPSAGSANFEREYLPLNQGRGSIDQLTDEVAETDKISLGPLLSRLYSLLRYEHRPAPDENSTNGTAPITANSDVAQSNGINNTAAASTPTTTTAAAGATTGANAGTGSDPMEVDYPSAEAENKPLPSATSFPEASPGGFKVSTAKLDHAQLDERLKAELRYVGFLGPDDGPDYDAHYDDDIAQRLRLLQCELKKQIVVNSARKAIVLDIARERMAYQEFITIHDDLDSQVQQAYLKRTRTLGKSKKGSQTKHRAGAAGGGGGGGGNGGGSHIVAAGGVGGGGGGVGGSSSGVGVGRPAIGDVARTLMDRRKRWRDCIGPVFKDSKTSVPGKAESIFEPALMMKYEKAELEGWDEEQE